jgi:hypothetical protein
MNQVLTQSEVDALLSAVAEGNVDVGGAPGGGAPGGGAPGGGAPGVDLDHLDGSA